MRVAIFSCCLSALFGWHCFFRRFSHSFSATTFDPTDPWHLLGAEPARTEKVDWRERVVRSGDVQEEGDGGCFR